MRVCKLAGLAGLLAGCLAGCAGGARARVVELRQPPVDQAQLFVFVVDHDLRTRVALRRPWAKAEYSCRLPMLTARWFSSTARGTRGLNDSTHGDFEPSSLLVPRAQDN